MRQHRIGDVVKYDLKDGRYVLTDAAGRIVYEGGDVAMLVDIETGTMTKHGDPRLVKAHWIYALEKISQGGADALPLTGLALVEWKAGGVSAEDLTRCLTTSGFAGKLVRQYLEESIVMSPGGSC